MRLKENGTASEVIAVSCGVAACRETLRTALAMGADRAILVQTAQELQPLAVARLLRVIVQRESPSLVILGKQAIDDDCNQTGQMLAALADMPQATFANRIGVDGASIQVTRDIVRLCSGSRLASFDDSDDAIAVDSCAQALVDPGIVDALLFSRTAASTPKRFDQLPGGGAV